jgi:hypothetical protein
MALVEYAAAIGAGAVVVLILIAFGMSKVFGIKKSGESPEYYRQFELSAKSTPASDVQNWGRRSRTRKSTRSNKK